MADRQMITDVLQRLLKSHPITIEEKGQVIHCMHDKRLRSVITEVLQDVKTPKPLSSQDCLKQLADIIKFILTLFVHEQSNDYKLLYSVLDSSHQIYSMGGPSSKRKQFLYTLLEDHGIWHGDAHNWRECIQEIIQLKVADAVKRKARKVTSSFAQSGTSPLVQTEEGSSSGTSKKNIFSKGFKQLRGLIQQANPQQRQLLAA